MELAQLCCLLRNHLLAHSQAFPLVLLVLFFFNCVFILKGFHIQRERQRGRQRESDLWCTGSFPRWPQQPAMGWAHARSQNLHWGLPCGWWRPWYLDHLLLFFPSISREQLEQEPSPIQVAGIEGGVLTSCASVLALVLLCFLKYLRIYLSQRLRGTMREMRQFFHLQIHSPNVHNRHVWAMLNSGARDPIWIAALAWQGWVLGPSSAAFWMH